jgi:hypothetical protein
MAGWLDNFGKEDNYNDYQTHAPEGFQGDGYSNVGRNSSPAWGGQFQMGGSIPGLVGFSYQRTGDIASNGKYAKKTKASAQNGKEMQYYQQGLDFQPKTISQNGSYHTGDKVTYGTPEYREAYDKGEVITKEGVHSPIALPEVVVQGKKKDKNWLEQYASKIAEENRDAGVLGAILGTPISAVTSLPQLMGMKVLTGEMQRPSEGLDIQNPYGAMAVDAIADPANLIGAGELSGLSKLGKEKAFAKLAASKESGLLSHAHELNPWAFKPNSEAYYRQIYGEEALNSPIITRSMAHANDPKGINSFIKAEEEIHHLNDNPVNILKLPQTSSFSNDALPYFNKGEKYYGSNNFKDQPKEFLLESNFNAKDYEDFYPASMRDVSIDPIQSEFANKMFGDIRVLNPFSKEGHDLSNYNLYKKDWLQGYKKVPNKENGGIIKDDRGQWDHPGEITEISGDTMATHGYGDIPLYVVPDKGKPRMVQPNTGTQKFPGAKKFTEYPMAQNGLRQEQKGLQNLDNLVNFTNYNTKQPGGWLDQY